MSEALILKTERDGVILRELSTNEDDIAYFEAIEEDREHLSRHGNRIAEKYKTLEDVRLRRLTSGSDLRMGIWDEDNEFKGMVSGRPNEEGTEAEIGLWLRASATGHGYATIAVKAIAAYLKPRYPRVFAETHTENTASSNVLQRAGLVKTGDATREWGPALIFDLPRQ